ncbi:MAG: polyprenyl synthetase family protein [Myxococcaceae bacterium]|nr:polyprenyl synthetase family protein [Myxococcaceae bacterium]
MPDRIELALHDVLARAAEGAPARLTAALRHAVFPGGARVRPQLCQAVAAACGDDAPALTDAASAALELLHCASLVHDDLPCFDDASLRRGRPAVHRAHGEAMAVLAGDALIVLAFEALATAKGPAARVAKLVAAFARAAGTPYGLVAGQAWESERGAPLERYHRAKTGSLFVAAVSAGALSAGHDPAPWQAVGDCLGRAYQLADDLLDVCATPAEAGKPTGQDWRAGRPNAVFHLGVHGTVTQLRELVAAAAAAVPACAGADALRALVFRTSERLVPAALKQTAA